MNDQSSTSIRVAVVEDQADVRELLRTNLELDDRFEFVGEAEDGQSGIGLVLQHRPDVVVLDLSMPKMDGLATLKLIRTEVPETKVVVFSAQYDRYDADQLLEDRAHLYLDKSKPVMQVLDEIAAVVAKTDSV